MWLLDASVSLIRSHDREALDVDPLLLRWNRSDLPQSRSRLWCGRRVQGAGRTLLLVDGHFDRATFSPQRCNAAFCVSQGISPLRHADRDNQLRVRRLPCSKGVYHLAMTMLLICLCAVRARG